MRPLISLAEHLGLFRVLLCRSDSWYPDHRDRILRITFQVDMANLRITKCCIIAHLLLLISCTFSSTPASALAKNNGALEKDYGIEYLAVAPNR